MTITYGEYRWLFDAELFADVVIGACEEQGIAPEFIAEYIGRDAHYFSNLRTYETNGKNVSMYVVLEVCSILDIYPSDFFIVEKV